MSTEYLWDPELAPVVAGQDHEWLDLSGSFAGSMGDQSPSARDRWLRGEAMRAQRRAAREANAWHMARIRDPSMWPEVDRALTERMREIAGPAFGLADPDLTAHTQRIRSEHVRMGLLKREG